MEAKIFYSWQSDIRPAAANRTLIHDALEAAAREISAGGAVGVEPVIDRDTRNVPGSPDIGLTIFKKIAECDVFVADVTIINSGAPGRPSPNPNVLVEVGYALRAVGEGRLVLVQNIAFGPTEDLPFDLRTKRVLTYKSPSDAPERSSERKRLQGALREAIALVLGKEGLAGKKGWAARFAMDYEKEKITSEVHEYNLNVTIENTGTRIITDWHIDVDIPERIMRTGVSYPAVSERSNRRRKFLRYISGRHANQVYPGDKVVISVPYKVDDDIYEDREELFPQHISAWAYVHGELVGSAQKPLRDLQCF